MIIDGNSQNNLNSMDIEVYYRLQPPTWRRAEHHCAIMYRLSRKKKKLAEIGKNSQKVHLVGELNFEIDSSINSTFCHQSKILKRSENISAPI